MKRTLTLLIGVFTIGSVIGQTTAEQEEIRRVILGKDGREARRTEPSRDQRGVIFGDERDRRVYDERGHRYPDNYPNGSAERERVNQDYDAKIRSIRNNPYLSEAEKERAIRQLNNDRARRLKELNKNKNYRRDDNRRYDDDDNYRKDKKDKKNNGNHYGWKKGKGNPHKGGKKGK